MRPLWFLLLIAGVISLVVHLTRFSREDVDRVEVHVGSAPPLLLMPGNSANTSWGVGRSVVVAAFVGTTQVSEGTVSDMGMGLTYHQRSQTKSIEAAPQSRDSLELTLTNVDLKTSGVTRQVFLRLERRADQLLLEFPARPEGSVAR